MDRLHHSVRDQPFRRWLAIFLASGLMVWAMLLMATEHRAAVAAGLAGPVIHPAAETTHNALPRVMCGDEHGHAWVPPDTPGDDAGDGFGNTGLAVVDRGCHIADDAPAGAEPAGDASPASWKATPVEGSRAPPVRA